MSIVKLVSKSLWIQTQTQQQIRLLKQIMKNIEEKSLKEKTVLQKNLKCKMRNLKEQMSEMRITECGLRTELRQLYNKVQILKQQHNRPIRQSPSILPKRSSSVESLTRFSGGYIQDTCSSNRSRRSSNNQIAGSSRASSRSNSLNSRRSVSSIGPATNSSGRKFNPTKYVNSRRMNLQENEFRLG